jgi:hypothetical protein
MAGPKSKPGKWLSLAGRALLVMAAIPDAVHAQACPLCYQTAASSSAELIAALKNGVFVLIVPSFLICAGISYVTYRKRNVCDEEEVSTGE